MRSALQTQGESCPRSCLAASLVCRRLTASCYQPSSWQAKEFICRYRFIDAYTCNIRISIVLTDVSSAGEVQQCIREGQAKGRDRHMRQPMFIIRLASALIVLASGCAAPTAEVGSGVTQPGNSGSANGAELKGT